MNLHRPIAACLLGLVLVSSIALAADAVEGQIVCSNCWFEADRARVAYGTQGDLKCARECDEAGIPTALAVRNPDGSFELLEIVGAAPPDVDWLEWTGRFVRAVGEPKRKKDKATIRIEKIELLQKSPWPLPAAGESGDAVELAWTDLSERTLALDDFHGRVVVLNFWATWCAPCRKEMPDLVRVQADYGLLGVQVVGASADPVAHADDVMEFARSKKLNFPVVLGANTAQMHQLGLSAALPATIVFDRDGAVVERFEGVFKRDALEAAIERALHGGDEHSEKHDAHEGAGHVHVARADRATPASLVPS